MKFVSIRDFRANLARVREDLAKEQEIVLTSSGKPFALLTPLSAEDLEGDLKAVRSARARRAVDRMREEAKRMGLDKHSMQQIDQVVSRTRRGRRKPPAGS